MRKMLCMAGLFGCLAFSQGSALAGQPNHLTHCMWPMPGGKICGQKERLKHLFYLPPGKPVGCISKPGLVVTNKNTHKRWVALTFDDGPSPWTGQILDVLKKNKAKATFFLIGQQVQSGSRLIHRIQSEGHLLANHSWSHPMLTSSAVDVKEQMYSTQNSIKKVSGFHPCLMRPPYGAWNKRVQNVALASGLQVILWDVDTQDWRRPGANSIRNSAVGGTRPGSIILMHDGGGDRSQTLQALPGIIKGLRSRGFQIVRLDKLLGVKLKRAN